MVEFPGGFLTAASSRQPNNLVKIKFEPFMDLLHLITIQYIY